MTISNPCPDAQYPNLIFLVVLLSLSTNTRTPKWHLISGHKLFYSHTFELFSFANYLKFDDVFCDISLLRSWVRISPGAWMFVCCECCVLSGRGLCDEPITRQQESYRLWCVVVCDLETSWMRRPWPTLGRSATRKKKSYFVISINGTVSCIYIHSTFNCLTFRLIYEVTSVSRHHVRKAYNGQGVEAPHILSPTRIWKCQLHVPQWDG